MAQSANALNAGDYPTAAALAQQALQIARQGGASSRYWEWRALSQQTDIAYTRGLMAEAVGYARQEMAIAQVLGIDTVLVHSYTELGNALSENQQWQEADGWLRRARAGYQRLGNLRGESQALANLAWNALYQHQLQAARTFAEEALTTAQRQSVLLYISNALDARANVLAAQGLYAAAIADSEKALVVAKAYGAPREVMFVYGSMPPIYEKAGRLTEALAAERRYTAMRDSFNSVDVSRQMAELNTRFRVGQQQARIAALTQQQRITTLNADRALARARLWSFAAIALTLLLLVGGWLLRQVRRSRAQLAASEADLRAANNTKDQLMRIIGHDLRAPLATFQQIAPLVDKLADAPDAAEQHALAKALGENARAVSDLVDNLLAWSRAQTGQVVAFSQPVRLPIVGRSMQQLFGPLAAAKQLRLTVTVGEALPDPFFTDPNLLAAVLRNLLGNAIKFTPPGGSITLDIAPHATGALLTVADSGVGMPPEKLAAALAGSSTVSSTAGTHGEGGTGLGLAVCRHFATLLGATWTGHSTPGQGTQWQLVLPQGSATL